MLCYVAMNQLFETYGKPVTTPLSEQQPRPNTIPGDWYGRSHEAQTHYLKSHIDVTRIGDYLSASMETGVKRLDSVALAMGRAAFYETSWRNQLDTPDVHASFEDGVTHHITLRHLSAPVKDGPMDLRAQLYSTAESVEEYFGPELLNKHLLFDMFGLNTMSGRAMLDNDKKLRAFETGTFQAIRAAEWDVSLRGLAGVQQMHQASARIARQLVRPLLDLDNMQPMLPGREEQFWRTKLGGGKHNLGMAYLLGYRAKSSETLKATMQNLWGNQYGLNREVFTSAMNISTRFLPKGQDALKRHIQKHIRGPVFEQIGKGDFTGAFETLYQNAQKRPEIFSVMTRQSLESMAARQKQKK